MNDKTLTAICDVMDETDADEITWIITTVDGKRITIHVENITEENDA